MLLFYRKSEITNDTFWLEKYENNQNHPLVSAYFQQDKNHSLTDFKERKTFNELAGKLASLFNQRRNGNKINGNNRPLRCYPPMFETHPYLVRDEGDRRSIIMQADELPNQPKFSEVLARKRYVGQRDLTADGGDFATLFLGNEPASRLY
ncbi:hypothetical protein PN471_10690 [Aphanizomenon sp. CS-733/32]|uniref:hypothetical protein n=1 Tax=Aphanizomenon sp. CS-733/32 TaxID=3021715 RepID=UPI00232A8008|nr:hypothetical protein [Aphanizomenon sp. CS-733/32]MDB9309097.1 hypothetical protein [Aphanizomenon sp. CS-733/32]